jgi:hypothetical protein
MVIKTNRIAFIPKESVDYLISELRLAFINFIRVSSIKPRSTFLEKENKNLQPDRSYNRHRTADLSIS